MQAPSIVLCVRRHDLGSQLPYVKTFLEAAGYNVRQVVDGPLKIASSDVLWVIGHMGWFPRVRRQLLATPPAERPYVMLWHTEPLPLPSAADFPRPGLQLREIAKIVLRDKRAIDIHSNARLLRQLARSGIPDLLVVSTASRQEFLAEKGISSEWVPLGYHATLGRDLRLERDIDVLFLGTPDDARHRKAVRSLRRKGVKVLAKGSWTDPALWGEERVKLINRARIFLGIQRRPGELSGARMILGMANKSLVIAEPIYKPAPYVPGRHYISARLDAMPEVIEHYLRDDSDRERIVNEAFRFVNEELTMDRSMSRIIGLLERHRADRSS